MSYNPTKQNAPDYVTPLVELALRKAFAAIPTNSDGPLGAVQFSNGAGSFLSDDPNFHWDNLNNRLGLGTNTPNTTLQIIGGLNQSSGTFSLVGNAASNVTSLTDLNILGTTLLNLDSAALLQLGTVNATAITIGHGNAGVTITAIAEDVSIDALVGIEIGVANATTIEIGHNSGEGPPVTVTIEGTDIDILTDANNIDIDAASGDINIGAVATNAVNIGKAVGGPSIFIQGVQVNIVSSATGIVATADDNNDFALQLTNTAGTNTSNGTLITAGANAATGAIFLEFDRPDGTFLATVEQTAADAVSFLPGTDNTGSIGSNALRWALVRATTVTTGDLEMVSEERNAHWIIQEEHDRIVAFNKITGKKYAFPLVEID